MEIILSFLIENCIKMGKVIVKNTDSDELDSSVESELDENNDDSTKPASKGLANVMARILASEPDRKIPILAKARVDKERIKKRKAESTLANKDADASVNTKDNVVSFENENISKNKAEDDEEDQLPTTEEHKEKLLKKKLWEEMCHVCPPFSSEEIQRSRKLKRIATKGVVKLFNSVLQHRAIVNEKMKKDGTTEGKREKIMKSTSKGQFLDMLKDKETSVEPKIEIKEEPMEEEHQPMWDALRDEYMMDSKMKDWDKDSENDDGKDFGSSNASDSE